MSFSSLFLSMLLSINSTFPHSLSFNFPPFASLIISQTQEGVDRSSVDNTEIEKPFESKDHENREDLSDLELSSELPHINLFFLAIETLNTSQEILTAQNAVRVALKKMQEVEKSWRVRKIISKLLNIEFQLLKKNLELIQKDLEKNKRYNTKQYAIFELIRRSHENNDFHKFLFEFIKNSASPEIRSIQVLEALVAQVQNNPELLENILSFGISLASTEEQQQSLLKALATQSRKQVRLQWSIFGLSRFLGNAGLQVLIRLSKYSQGNPKLQLEIMKYLNAYQWTNTPEGILILSGLAGQSGSNAKLKEILLTEAKKQSSFEAKLNILYGLAGLYSNQGGLQDVIYKEIKENWDRELEKLEPESTHEIKEETMIAHVFSNLIKSAKLSSKYKQEIFESLSKFHRSQDKVILLKAFAKHSAIDPEFQDRLFKNIDFSVENERDRAKVLKVLISQVRKNYEIQLEIFEYLKEMKNSKLISSLLSSLIQVGYLNEPLQKRILKYIDSHLSDLCSGILFSAFAKVSKKNLGLQNWLIRRLDKINAIDKVNILVTLASIPQLEPQTREKIRDELKSSRHELAKTGLALLEFEF